MQCIISTSSKFRNCLSNPFCHCKRGQTLTKNIFTLPKYFSVCISLQQHVDRGASWLPCTWRWMAVNTMLWVISHDFQMEFQSSSSKTKIYVDYQQMTRNIVCYILFLNYLSAFKRHFQSVTFFSLNFSDIKWEKIIVLWGKDQRDLEERGE